MMKFHLINKAPENQAAPENQTPLDQVVDEEKKTVDCYIIHEENHDLQLTVIQCVECQHGVPEID